MRVRTCKIPEVVAPSDENEDAVARINGAPARMLELETARVYVGTGIDTPQLPSSEPFGEAVADFTSCRVRVRQSFGPRRLATEWPIKGKRRAWSPAQRAVRAIISRVVRPGDFIYDGIDAFRRRRDGSWIEFSPSWCAPGVDRHGPRRPDDPTWLLDALRATHRDVTLVDQETVRGAGTTHYRFVVDLVAAAAELPAGLTLPEPVSAGKASWLMPVELWLGEQGEIRRMSYREPSEYAETPFWRTTEFSDFGIAVEIAVPEDAIRLNACAVSRK